MDDTARLAALATSLRTIKARGLATQQAIERATSIDQTVISRIINGQRKRFTPPLHRLEVYADMLLTDVIIPMRVLEAAKAFLIVGTECELVALIDLARKLVTRDVG